MKLGVGRAIAYSLLLVLLRFPSEIVQHIQTRDTIPQSSYFVEVTKRRSNALSEWTRLSQLEAHFVPNFPER